MEENKNNQTKTPKNKKGLIIHYAISIVIEIALLFTFFAINDLFNKTDLVAIYKILSDSFGIVGIIALCVGLLIALGNQGAFNFLSFSALKVASKFVPKMKITTMSYGDYISEKSKGKVQFLYLLITGGVLIVVSFVFLFLFYSIYEG